MLPCSILYVDDEPDLLELCKLFLEESGDFSVSLEKTGESALSALKENKFDAIISDYQMPGMSGIELLKQIRSSGNKIPIIIFTGRGREEVVIEALNAGADFYLQKGGDPASQFVELKHKIRQAVRRRSAERLLKESEEKYRRIVETSLEGIWSMDGQYKTTFVNEQMANMLGYKVEEMIGRSVTSFMVNGEFADHSMKMEYRRRGKSGKYERSFRKKDGTVCIGIVSASPLIDEKGLFEGSIAMVTDITKRVNAENEVRQNHEDLIASYEELTATNEVLRQTMNELTLKETQLQDGERKYRNLFHYAQVALFETSLGDAKIIACNQRYCDLFGFLNVDEAIGKDVLHLYVKVEDREEVKRIMREQGFIADNIVLFRNQLTGENFWGEFNARIDPERDIAEGSIVDISGRKSFEEEILFKNLLFSTEQEASPDGILIVDEEGKIINFNNQFMKIWEIPEEIITSKSDERAIKSVLGKVVDPDAFIFRIEYLYKHLNEKSYEEILLKDGRILERYSAPMLNDKNEYFGRVWYFRDITERKRDIARSKASEERYRELINNMKSGVAVYRAIDNGSDFIFEDINHGVELIENIKREDIIGKKITDVLPGMKSSGLFSVFCRVWTDGRPESHIVSNDKNDREYGYLENFVYKLHSGEIVSIYEDIKYKRDNF